MALINVTFPNLEATKKWLGVPVPKELPDLIFVGKFEGWYVEYQDKTLGPYQNLKEIDILDLSVKLDLHPGSIIRAKLKVFYQIDDRPSKLERTNAWRTFE